ncbi:alpha/beta hydrolase [Maliponia aquimaris]|uniref:Alpha/beta hydrolase family protein n=1 Tax=Maliponia aquimaris TaxID=1673631 RepID=A0A238K1B8_9RHOB|nr:alpha/beta fold hydrolase [Maliponia aquimaris]SMX36690.1 Alpha/beta hydrolase family protein [Maliponia aquimaris]
MSRIVVVLILSLSIVGCAPRGVITVVQGFMPDRYGATVQRVYIASNRHLDAEAPDEALNQTFGESRDAVLRYGHMDISIPPVHEIGRIEWPEDQTPDPARHFVARSGERYANQQAFLRALPRNNGRPDVVLFVHGFNINNAEAIYRLAQIAHDFETDDPVISFSWPSAGDPRGYVYDRDSVIFTRDDLETLLKGLSAANRRTLIVAHSMGSQLVMETLRQMAISGSGAALADLSGVALISPDIDEDVFLRQASRIKPFPQPFLIIVSTRDRALSLSAFLTGTPTRLGSIQNPARLANLPIDIIDLSSIEGGDRTGHSTAFTSPVAIRLLRDLAAP